MEDFLISEEDVVQKACRAYWIELDKYSINYDSSIDVFGNVKFPDTARFLKELPFQFNKVTGDFDCSRLSLTTLKGSPLEVGGNFYCAFNPLLSLEYAPKIVGGTFAFDNKILSFYSNSNHNFSKVELVKLTDIPEQIFIPDLIIEHSFQLSKIMKYQHYYNIWNLNKTLNESNMQGSY